MSKMKKIKKNGGFSLVELIVVIVIILVLAAVMVPNVSKYIDMAGESNTKNNAATLLSQAQAEVAEEVGRAHMEGRAYSFDDVKLGNTTIAYKATTDSTLSSGKLTTTAYSSFKSATVSGDAARYTIDTDKDNQVIAFCYRDGKHFIAWTVDHGWYAVDDASDPNAES